LKKRWIISDGHYVLISPVGTTDPIFRMTLRKENTDASLDHNAVVRSMFAVLAVVAVPGVGRAAFVVNPGWDLFHTLPGSTLGGSPLVGVPAVGFNFAGVGTFPTGDADTIIHRTQAVNGVTGTSPLVVEYLALCTQNPIQLLPGLPVAIYCETLRTSLPSSITITTNPDMLGGTFTSHLDFLVDIRIGSPTGAIVATGEVVLDSTNGTWTRTPPPGPPQAVQINGVNTLLNGVDRSTDFWPVTVTEIGTVTVNGVPLAVQHAVGPAIVPEPSSLVLFGFGVAGMGGLAWRRGKRAA